VPNDSRDLYFIVFVKPVLFFVATSPMSFVHIEVSELCADTCGHDYDMFLSIYSPLCVICRVTILLNCDLCTHNSRARSKERPGI
jgi:hypothetical protein